jgi:hypothetical protein
MSSVPHANSNELNEPTATSKMRRSEDPKLLGTRPPRRASRVRESENRKYKQFMIQGCLYLQFSDSLDAGRRPAAPGARSSVRLAHWRQPVLSR